MANGSSVKERYSFVFLKILCNFRCVSNSIYTAHIIPTQFRNLFHMQFSYFILYFLCCLLWNNICRDYLGIYVAASSSSSLSMHAAHTPMHTCISDMFVHVPCACAAHKSVQMNSFDARHFCILMWCCVSDQAL